MLKLDVDAEVYPLLLPERGGKDTWWKVRSVMRHRAYSEPDLEGLLPWEKGASRCNTPHPWDGYAASGKWVESVPTDIVASMLKIMRRACHLSQVQLAQQVGQSEGWYRNREAGTVATTPDDWTRIWAAASRSGTLDVFEACEDIKRVLQCANVSRRAEIRRNLPNNAKRGASMVEELCGLLTPQELAHVLGLVASIAESRADEYQVEIDRGGIRELGQMLAGAPYYAPVGCLRMPDEGAAEENPA